MMADIFGKMIQKRRGGKNVKTEGDKSQKKETKKRAKSKSPTLVIRVWWGSRKRLVNGKKHPQRLEGCRIISRYKPSTQRSAEDSRCWYLQVYLPWSSRFRSLIRSFWTLCFTSDVYLPFISNCWPFLNHWASTLGMDNWQDRVHDWPSLPDVSCRCFSTSASERQNTRRRKCNIC